MPAFEANRVREAIERQWQRGRAVEVHPVDLERVKRALWPEFPDLAVRIGGGLVAGQCRIIETVTSGGI